MAGPGDASKAVRGLSPSIAGEVRDHCVKADGRPNGSDAIKVW